MSSPRALIFLVRTFFLHAQKLELKGGFAELIKEADLRN